MRNENGKKTTDPVATWRIYCVWEIHPGGSRSMIGDQMTLVGAKRVANRLRASVRTAAGFAVTGMGRQEVYRA